MEYHWNIKSIENKRKLYSILNHKTGIEQFELLTKIYNQNFQLEDILVFNNDSIDFYYLKKDLVLV